ncbi:MAG: helix-turn-helix domain-containing protein [Candidatus Hydrothermarchaeales archaeon]
MKNLPDLKTPYRKQSVEEIMYCMFGLKKFETKIYFDLIEQGPSTVNKLLKRFEKNRSTIQRALQDLTLVGLIFRERENIKGGGYYYIYHAAPFEDVKKNMKASIEKWSTSVTTWIDSL